MTFKLKATITHKSFDAPVIKEVYYQGPTFNDILAKIEADQVPQYLLHNLRHYRKAAFKDARGVKHKWQLEEMVGLN